MARGRRGLIAASAICAGVPIAVVASLWSNLTVPFWYNEQWRAFYISNPTNWWEALKGDGAPFPAGWYFLERVAGSLFGSTELVLRIPTAFFIPVGCVLLMLLARRWMPLSVAVVVALLATFTGTLFSFGLQLSEYQIDAACVIAVLLLHELASEVDAPSWRAGRLYAMYGGIALACIFSTPTVFVAGPLLLLDAGREAAKREVGPRLAAALGAGVVALLHLVLFVLPQSALTATPYWDNQFLPHHGLGTQLAFVWDGLEGFVTGVFTSSPAAYLPGSLLGQQWAWVLTLAFGSMLLVGALVAGRTSRGRVMLFAIGCSFALTLIASYFRHWPFGFVRTNYYLVPVLIFIAGIGAHRSATWFWSRVQRARSGTDNRRLWPAIAIGSAAVVLVVAGFSFAAIDEVGSYRQVRASTTALPYGVEIGGVVATVRSHAHPGAALVVAGVMAIPGWQYYDYEYSGKSTQTGRKIPPDHAAFVEEHGSPAIARTIARLNPSQVFVYIPYGTSGRELNRDVAQVSRGRTCRTTSSENLHLSGLLVTLACSRTS